jgi:hypothetical protein
MDKIKDIFNMVVDSPNMVNNKLPWNCWNSCMNDSEGNIAKWAGEVFRVGAFVILVFSIIASVSGMIPGDDGVNIMAVLGGLVWIYVAFPIAQIIRDAGNSVASSTSDIITLFWHDIALATIRAWGYVTALVALVAALLGIISAVTLGNLDMTGSVDVSWLDNMDYFYALPASAMDALTNMFGLEWVGERLNDLWGWNITDGKAAADGTWAGGLIFSLWGLVQVAVILLKLYVVLAIYKWIWTILNTLFKFIANPYLPFKSK